MTYVQKSLARRAIEAFGDAQEQMFDWMDEGGRLLGLGLDAGSRFSTWLGQGPGWITRPPLVIILNLEERKKEKGRVLKGLEGQRGKGGRQGRSGEMFEKVRLDLDVTHPSGAEILGQSASPVRASGNNGESVIGQCGQDAYV
ncbi:hypothetical protein TWF718_006713 [Orbilia javanica]|uniref:Uncharacterized protein n=1 Tax=Orbilia javanica TaxID=47235 RepID=A0AAN8RCM8_9PEZI